MTSSEHFERDEHGNPRYSPQDRTEYDRSQYERPAYGPYGQPGHPGYGGYAPYGVDPATAAYPAWAPPAPPARGGVRRPLLVGAGSGLVAAAVVLGVVAGVNPNAFGRSAAGLGTTSQADGGTSPIFPNQLSPYGGTGSGSSGGTGSGGSGSGGSGSGGTGSRAAATDAQKQGIVTINSVLKYQSAESAGTGMVLSPTGEILTNNHVINGATSIVVTVVSTGKQYRADVVGTAPTKDVAVLQLRNATGLTTATLDSDNQGADVGNAITGVGNAGGTGALLASTGKVTGTNKTITAADEQGADAERLHGMIQIDAPIISGDSGGPLYDSAGEVVGMDTAASSSGNATTGPSTATTAYAIPIDSALGVAQQIESGVQTTAIHIGYPGFLGVSTTDVTAGKGAGVAGLLAGGPAAKAGITAGSVITSVDGKDVTSASQLKTVLTAKKPGTQVTIGWTDVTGSTHSRTVALGTGPAD